MSRTLSATADRQAAAIAACVGALAFLFCLLFYPGVASWDVVTSFTDLAEGRLSDWHPPILPRLWQFFLSLGWPGTGPFFLIQALLFFGGIAALSAAQARQKHFASAFALVILCCVPSIFGWMTVVVKDAQMTAAMVAATGLTGWYRLRSRTIPVQALVAIAALCAYATILRWNAVFSVAPLVAILAFHSSTGMPRPMRAGAVLGLAIVFFLLAPQINQRILGAEPSVAHRTQQLYDIAGIAHFAELPTIPGVPEATWRQAEEQGCYNSYAWDSLGLEQYCPPVWKTMRDQPLTALWISSILSHPVAYVQHRLNHLNASLRFVVARSEPRGVSQAISAPNVLGLGSDFTSALQATWRLQLLLNSTPTNWPFAWYVAGAMVAWLAAGLQSSPLRNLVFACIASALVQMLSFSIVSVAADVRYHHWPMTAVGIACALLIGQSLPLRRLAISAIVVGAACLLGVIGRLVLVPAWPLGFG